MKKTDPEWREALTPQQFEVCRNKGTERAFSGAYYECKDSGFYHCVCCHNKLFSSESKYDSGSGWPSFYTPVDDKAIKTESDNSAGIWAMSLQTARSLPACVIALIRSHLLWRRKISRQIKHDCCSGCLCK